MSRQALSPTLSQREREQEDTDWCLGHEIMSTTLNIPTQFELVDRPLDTQMTISMGPQHPSTHGVLRLELVLDGEMVVKSTPDIGYLHTGMEKLFEYRKYQQGIVITDRMDYLNPLGNNLAYVMAVEKLLQIEIPERAQVIRVLTCELQRIASMIGRREASRFPKLSTGTNGWGWRRSAPICRRFTIRSTGGPGRISRTANSAISAATSSTSSNSWPVPPSSAWTPPARRPGVPATRSRTAR